MSSIDKDVLNVTYRELYEAVGENDELLLNIWDRLRGQQINLPEHMYDRKLVENTLMEKAKNEPLDVAKEADFFGYSRRWVRELERRSKQKRMDNE